jgi:hypothetical protein
VTLCSQVNPVKAGHWGFAGSDCIIQCRPRLSNHTSQVCPARRLRLPSNLNVELEPFHPLSVQRWRIEPVRDWRKGEFFQ